MTRNGAAGRARWLIARRTNGMLDVLTLEGRDGQILPVFSFEDEALLYASLQVATPGWEPRVTTPGELLSVLYGPLSDVARVALDPLPEVCDKTVLDLLCVGRETFMCSLTGVRRGAAPAEAAPSRPAETSLRKSRSADSRAAATAANG